MAEHFDAASAKQRYQLLDDAALIRIVYGAFDYAPEAIALARDELTNRGISENHPVVASTQETDKAAAIAEKDQPLHAALKALCFVLTPLPALVMALWYFASGRKRAAKDALAWMFFWSYHLGCDQDYSLEHLGHMPNNSFKPKPLRGSA